MIDAGIRKIEDKKDQIYWTIEFKITKILFPL